jgi:hypothetical protein
MIAPSTVISYSKSPVSSCSINTGDDVVVVVSGGIVTVISGIVVIAGVVTIISGTVVSGGVIVGGLPPHAVRNNIITSRKYLIFIVNPFTVSGIKFVLTR